MPNYAETTRGSTIVSVTPLSLSPSQDVTASPSSYVIGPIDPARITTVQAQLATGGQYTLFVPADLAPSLLAHPVFQEGCEWGYLDSAPEIDEWTVPKLLNFIYRDLAELLCTTDPDFFPWTHGFVLGELAGIAECDQTLALTGLAHYRFLLPLLTLERPLHWPHYEPYDAYFLHRGAIKAYREQVHVHRQHGKNFDEAQRLVLAGNEE